MNLFPMSADDWNEEKAFASAEVPNLMFEDITFTSSGIWQSTARVLETAIYAEATKGIEDT